MQERREEASPPRGYAGVALNRAFCVRYHGQNDSDNASDRAVGRILIMRHAHVPHELEFSYEGMPVGYFEEQRYPTVAGRYRYMPYRGPGHYKMQTARRAGARPRCTFHTDNRAVSFVVVDCPEYGVLELAEFSGEDPA